MSFIKKIIIIIMIYCAVFAFLKYRLKLQAQLAKEYRTTGFVKVSRPDNTPEDKVLILGPINCPLEAGKRTDNLERKLRSAGIPCFRLKRVSFMSGSDVDMNKIDEILSSDSPVVFVGNYAKSNPDFSEVRAEYQRLMRDKRTLVSQSD